MVEADTAAGYPVQKLQYQQKAAGFGAAVAVSVIRRSRSASWGAIAFFLLKNFQLEIHNFELCRQSINSLDRGSPKPYLRSVTIHLALSVSMHIRTLLKLFSSLRFM
jgi:hypothetical protein